MIIYIEVLEAASKFTIIWNYNEKIEACKSAYRSTWIVLEIGCH